MTESDRLSVNICHACISYLNSWQSFKNRCDAAQRKQKIWQSSSEGKAGQSLLKTQLNGHGNQLKPAIENAQQKFQETQAELQRKKLEQLVKQQQAKHQVDISLIKSEPASDDDVSHTMNHLHLVSSSLFSLTVGRRKCHGTRSVTVSRTGQQRFRFRERWGCESSCKHAKRKWPVVPHIARPDAHKQRDAESVWVGCGEFEEGFWPNFDGKSRFFSFLFDFSIFKWNFLSEFRWLSVRSVEQ